MPIAPDYKLVPDREARCLPGETVLIRGTLSRGVVTSTYMIQYPQGACDKRHIIECRLPNDHGGYSYARFYERDILTTNQVRLKFLLSHPYSMSVIAILGVLCGLLI